MYAVALSDGRLTAGCSPAEDWLVERKFQGRTWTFTIGIESKARIFSKILKVSKSYRKRDIGTARLRFGRKIRQVYI